MKESMRQMTIGARGGGRVKKNIDLSSQEFENIVEENERSRQK